MTPQVLLDVLRRAFFNLEAVGLMVIDECHRAIGNHPYTKIMKVNAVCALDISCPYSFLPLSFSFCYRCLSIIFDNCFLGFVKEFYHKCSSKPKIFGMTASPVVGKGSVVLMLL